MGFIVTESVETLIDANESLEKNKKQKEYLDYINNHISNVQKTFLKFFVPLLEKENISELFSDEEFKEAMNRLQTSIPEHDASKFSDDEFDGYREKYYPTSNELADPEFQQKVAEKAEEAWISHYKHNWHHPAYWINDDGEIQDMSLDAIIEMVCDWASFSISKGDMSECIKWYENEASKEKSQMTDKSKSITEFFLYNFVK